MKSKLKEIMKQASILLMFLHLYTLSLKAQGISPCDADVNEDGLVNNTDLTLLLSQIGTTCSNCKEDINKDGYVDGTDYQILTGALGTNCNFNFYLEDLNGDGVVNGFDYSQLVSQLGSYCTGCIEDLNSDNHINGIDYAMLVSNFGASERVMDIDGNIYNTALIGNKIWMTQNLKVTKYSDGTSLQFLQSNLSISPSNTTPYYSWYSNNEGYRSDYGALYSYQALTRGQSGSLIQGICPVGWHLPTQSDWIELIDFLGGSNLAGGKLKSGQNGFWANPNTGADNQSQFTAYPGGYRNNEGSFHLMGTHGFWWSPSGIDPENAKYFYLNYKSRDALFGDGCKSHFMSVRCIKN